MKTALLMILAALTVPWVAAQEPGASASAPREVLTWASSRAVPLASLVGGSDFKDLVRESPWLALRLFLFMCGFSAFMHLVGCFLAPWRPVADRAAISVNTAYVNNGLAIAFAVEFFRHTEMGAAAVLPAILLEAPMAVALVPLKMWVARRSRGEVVPGDERGS